VAVGCSGRGIRPLRFYRTSQNMRTSSAGFGPERHFAPVISEHGCAGHVLRTARGFRAFDADDKEVGTYATADIAVATLLELAVAEAA
jgi:hypothetical protein